MTYKELLNSPITPPDTTSNAMATRYEVMAQQIVNDNRLFHKGNAEPTLTVIQEEVLRPVTTAIKRQLSATALAKVIIDKALEGEEGFVKIILDRTEGKVTDKVEVTTPEAGEAKNKIVQAIQEMTKVIREAETIRVVKEVDGTDV